MKRQHGFALAAYLGFGAAAVILGLTLALKLKGAALDRCEASAARFEAAVRANGVVAAERAKAKRAEDNAAKEKSDAAYKTLQSSHDRIARELRDARAASRRVPAAPEGSRRPELACFDRTQLEQALGRLDAGLSAIAAEGDANTLRLKLSHDWALDRLKP